MLPETIIRVSDSIYLDLIKSSDKTILVNYMNEESIYKNTLQIPAPYFPKDADNWVKLVYDDIEKYGVQTNWAIRNKEGALVGGIGLINRDPKSTHCNEIGYWIAKPFRNQGIMTKVLANFVTYCHRTFGIIRIEANVFSFNEPSAKALENVGFEKEGYLKKRFKKDGKYLDSILYAKLMES